jgi:hypothetical protein
LTSGEAAEIQMLIALLNGSRALQDRCTRPDPAKSDHPMISIAAKKLKPMLQDFKGVPGDVKASPEVRIALFRCVATTPLLEHVTR